MLISRPLSAPISGGGGGFSKWQWKQLLKRMGKDELQKLHIFEARLRSRPAPPSDSQSPHAPPAPLDPPPPDGPDFDPPARSDRQSSLPSDRDADAINRIFDLIKTRAVRKN